MHIARRIRIPIARGQGPARWRADVLAAAAVLAVVAGTSVVISEPGMSEPLSDGPVALSSGSETVTMSSGTYGVTRPRPSRCEKEAGTLYLDSAAKWSHPRGALQNWLEKGDRLSIGGRSPSGVFFRIVSDSNETTFVGRLYHKDGRWAAVEIKQCTAR